MSLTQNDLGHGFLFRHKDDPEVIGRLSLGEYDYKNHIEFVEKGEWDEIKFNPLKWEGIPITAKLLEDWYQLRPSSNVSFEIPLFDDGGDQYINTDTGEITFTLPDDYYQRDWVIAKGITHIHDLQRLVLALKGKPLEGGPK